MFQCLVIYISRDKFTMFTPGLAIIYLAMILRSHHVCGVRAGFCALSRGQRVATPTLYGLQSLDSPRAIWEKIVIACSKM